MNTPLVPSVADATDMLTPQDIKEFQALITQETGKSMDAAEAWARATELVTLTRVLMGPIPEDPES
jgi:hypothetical protein